MRTVLVLLSACTISQTTGAINIPVTVDQVIPCDDETTCPERSFCEPGVAVCVTDVRCFVNGQPSNLMCERAFGRNFGCFEDAADSFHCVPIEPS